MNAGKDGRRPALMSAVKMVLAALLRLIYRVEVRGLEHYHAAGERAVVVANHLSLLDAPLLAAFLPGRPSLAITADMERCWWMRPWLALVDAFKVDPRSPLAMLPVVRALKRGGRCVMFPEGRLSVTGALMKVYDGPAVVAARTRSSILPVWIDGTQHSPQSPVSGAQPDAKARRRWFPQVTITILPARFVDLPDGVRGRKRRQLAGERLYDLMTEAAFEAGNPGRTLFEAMLDARARHGGAKVVFDDPEGRPLSYDRLVLAAAVLGPKLARVAPRGAAVGVLMPNVVGTAALFAALQAIGRVPAMLNFTVGPSQQVDACRVADLKLVVTARRFVAAAHLEAAVAALAAVTRIVYLEDIRASLTLADKLGGMLASVRARAGHRALGVKPDEPAVILFTSGSETQPKGVVLSHRNLVANCLQLKARVDFSPADVLFNALPVFHSFGMTGGMVLPLVSGFKCFLYPSPLHYRQVPEAAYGCDATMMFGTDTFLNVYGRTAHPYDFRAVRYIFAGAEALREETRRLWADRFGVRILEGYGATETGPVLAVNTPMFAAPGSVGRFLPGIRHRLEPVEGIAAGGRLLVSGPNIMIGYLKPEAPGVLEPTPDGWHDTGDIVSVDDHGFARIVGRLKRFAKVAGEMVSLSAAEALVVSLWPEHRHAVVAARDPRKGEQLVLVTDREGAVRTALAEQAHKLGVSELLIPRTVLVVGAVPLLCTGKIDYVQVQALAAARRAGRHAA
ncbi:MAG: AMP-binding protein [Rhodospirillaceae bacterium]